MEMNIAKKKKMLAVSIPKALEMLTCCTLCPRLCKVDRTQNQKGVCNTLDKALVSSFMPHHGEEPPLSGTRGSGTIFFTNCNLQCCFCQNEDISLRGSGETASPEQIAQVMILLQNQGCHNINFVTPTHVVPFILQAVDLALNMGLNLPLVYNCSGYETPDTLSLLDGIIDIYMPDFKFWDKKIARMACNAPDYPEVAKEAVKIMHKQVGDLCLDSDEIAQSGLLVRHLVLPHDFAGTESVMAFLAERVSKNTRVNIMSQYRPCGTADSIPELSRTITVDEYHRARQTAQSFGLHLLR